MKIKELTERYKDMSILDRMWETPDQLETHLSNIGAYPLWNEPWTRVWEHDDFTRKGFVLKVAPQIDYGWDIWANYCVENKGQPHIPLIAQHKSYSGPNGTWTATFMEKLEMENDAKLVRFLSPAYDDTDEKGTRSGPGSWLLDFATDMGVFRLNGEPPERLALLFRSHRGSFEKVSRDIIALTKSSVPSGITIYEDLHSQNIAWKGNTFVYLDPLAGRRSKGNWS